MGRPKPQLDIPRQKTVLLDKFNTGETFGYDASSDGRWCAGEPVQNDRDQQSSFMYSWSTRYKPE